MPPNPLPPSRPMRLVQRMPFEEEILPVDRPPVRSPGELPSPPLQAAGPPNFPPPPPSCAGTGLSSAATAQPFVQDFKNLRTEWPNLTPPQRLSRMRDIANRQLATRVVPPIRAVIPENLGGIGAGYMDPVSWNLAIDSGAINSNTLSEAEAREVAKALYHESRHAEQFYLAARRRADILKAAHPNATPPQLKDLLLQDMPIQPIVAEQAVGNPLAAGAPQAGCGEVIYNSIYGPGKAHREATLAHLKNRKQELDNAEQQHKTISAAPGATPAQIQQAQNARDNAQALYNNAFNIYQQLPEEADAWDSENWVQNAW